MKATYREWGQQNPKICHFEITNIYLSKPNPN